MLSCFCCLFLNNPNVETLSNIFSYFSNWISYYQILQKRKLNWVTNPNWWINRIDLLPLNLHYPHFHICIYFHVFKLFLLMVVLSIFILCECYELIFSFVVKLLVLFFSIDMLRGNVVVISMFFVWTRLLLLYWADD